jgi:two-component system cell cycle sensor histidine kinase/response regulator CckA
MSTPIWTPVRHQRILIIDDNRAIHDDFRKILGPPEAVEAEIDAAEARIFGSRQAQWFQVDVASQGQEGMEMVKQALEEGRPYSMAFVDFRMPPGWDGIETTKHLWDVSPDLQIVICTAYADCSWREVLEQINPGDRLLILKKPFDTVEAMQLASSLTEKWRLLQESRARIGDLDELVRQRTAALESSRLDAMSMMEDAVRNREREQQVCEDLKREMADRRKLEDKFREKASLLDLAGDAIFVCDMAHRVTYWNRSAERMYGWSASEMLGQSVSDLQGDESLFFQACDEVVQNGEWRGRLPQIGRHGGALVVDGRWTLMRDAAGAPHSILSINTGVTLRDIEPHARKRAEVLELTTP